MAAPKAKSVVRSMPSTNGLSGEVLTLAEAADYLRLSEDSVVELVQSQGLPGRFTGKEWRFLKSALQQWLSGDLSTPQLRKKAQLALVGKYKDDPDLARICEEAYRQRRSGK